MQGMHYNSYFGLNVIEKVFILTIFIDKEVAKTNTSFSTTYWDTC